MHFYSNSYLIKNLYKKFFYKDSFRIYSWRKRYDLNCAIIQTFIPSFWTYLFAFAYFVCSSFIASFACNNLNLMHYFIHEIAVGHFWWIVEQINNKINLPFGPILLYPIKTKLSSCPNFGISIKFETKGPPTFWTFSWKERETQLKWYEIPSNPLLSYQNWKT
jgi:hypothetical protein